MLLRLLRRYRKNEKGTTAVEFALVSIVFLTIIFAIFEAARIFWTLNTMQYAVEAGTRYVLTNTEASDDDIKTQVLNNVNGIETSATNPVITISHTTLNGVDFIVIDSVYTFTTLLPFVPSGWNNMRLDSSSRLPIPSS